MARTKYIRRTSKDIGKEAPEGYAFVTTSNLSPRKRRPPERFAGDGSLGETSRKSAAMRKGSNDGASEVEHENDDLNDESIQRKKSGLASDEGSDTDDLNDENTQRKKSRSSSAPTLDSAGDSQNSIESASIRKAMRKTSVEFHSTDIRANENGINEIGIYANCVPPSQFIPIFAII
jgi:hypothetical protein